MWLSQSVLHSFLMAFSLDSLSSFKKVKAANQLCISGKKTFATRLTRADLPPSPHTALQSTLFVLPNIKNPEEEEKKRQNENETRSFFKQLSTLLSEEC